MLRNWRAWILLLLLIVPIGIYVVLGALWLAEHRGPIGFRGELLTYATVAWIASGVAFSLLASRWTRSRESLLPPLDWEAPKTFTARDRQAWDLIQEEAARGDTLSMEALSRFDTYIDSGRRLAGQLARHYKPNATDPVEHVPVVDMLTAMQLAAEDLVHLCREVPGGDMITPAHWKRAVQAAGYVQRANEIYTFLLPLFAPAAGIARLGTQKLMVQPAWKNMQQNLMRWFYRAFVNRLGTHLVELYSGRLAIGAEQYRRLSRRGAIATMAAEREGPGPLVLGIAGARGSGKSTLRAMLDRARAGDLSRIREQLRGLGFDPNLVRQLQEARLEELPSFTVSAAGKESARDRSSRRAAVRAATGVDLLLLTVDSTRTDYTAEGRFLQELAEWFAAHPGRELPPVLVVLTRADRVDLPGPWEPPYDWANGPRPREVAIRAAMVALRSALPPIVVGVIPVGLRPEAPDGVVEHLLPEVAAQLHRAERAELLRHLERVSGRSKLGRLAYQVSRQGRRLWNGVRTAREAAPRDNP